MKKHVTIDDSSTGLSSEEQGIHTPKHMLPPGQDGYRTPTIGQYEMQTGGPTTPNGARTPASNGLATPNGQSTPNSLHNRLPHFRHHLSSSSTSLAHSILDKLHWRERIRHYTWTFFTMTMATGGIANVLHNGILSLCGPRSPSGS